MTLSGVDWIFFLNIYIYLEGRLVSAESCLTVGLELNSTWIYSNIIMLGEWVHFLKYILAFQNQIY